MNIKTALLGLSTVFTLLPAVSHAAVEDVTPRPVEVRLGTAPGYTISGNTGVTFSSAALEKELSPRLLTTSIASYLGKGKGIEFSLTDSVAGTSSPEAYVIKVDGKGIKVEAKDVAGLYYGAVTLGQIMKGETTVPSMTVTDYPRLGYRGMMVDVSRHFHGLDFLKKEVDAMAEMKLNRLHLHLTDAAGWRLEIKKYPRLSGYAAWRPQAHWEDWGKAGEQYCDEGTPGAYGGYFTAAQMRDLIDYAALRGIEIIPEIEMPGHSAEVTAAYPELGCPDTEGSRHDLCPGNEKTYEFLEGVLDEVMEIFPSKVIHIGGDEASKAAWKNCRLCQAKMQEEGLKDVDELQSYLISRMERYLNSKGRDLMGWDEIMEGGLAPNAIVMSWRGVEGGLRAAADGHHAVMTPGGYCYLDSYQDAPNTQPQAFGGYLPLKKVYSYNPIPDTIPEYAKSMIDGVQGNLWCEYVPTDEHAEYMLWPRMIAIAEVGWTPQDARSWDEFYPRAKKVNEGLKAKGYHVFDLDKEVGNRPEAQAPIDHLAKGAKVTYLKPYYKGYSAGGDGALTDGIRGGWNYSDQLWQGFISGPGSERVDVVIDLGKVMPVTFVGTDFMQICTPDVWMPSEVEIFASEDGENYELLRRIDHEVKADSGVSFLNFGWEGKTQARFIRYRALTPRGFLFTDEIVVK